MTPNGRAACQSSIGSGPREQRRLARAASHVGTMVDTRSDVDGAAGRRSAVLTSGTCSSGNRSPAVGPRGSDDRSPIKDVDAAIPARVQAGELTYHGRGATHTPRWVRRYRIAGIVTALAQRPERVVRHGQEPS